MLELLTLVSSMGSRMRSWTARVLLFGAVLVLPGCRAEPPGLRVESTEAWGTAADVGIESGERIVSWRVQGGPAASPVASPIHLARLEVERSPETPVILKVSDDESSRDVVLDRGEWELRAEPRLGGGDQTRFHRALDQFELPPAETGERFAELSTRAIDRGEFDNAAWLEYRAVRAFVEARDNLSAIAAADRARTHARQPLDRAMVLELVGVALFEAGLYDNARPRLEESLQLRREFGGPAAQASSLNHLARLGLKIHDFDLEALAVEARSLYETLPNSQLERAVTLNNLAGFAWYRRELEEAESYYLEALTLRNRIGRESLGHAMLEYNLGLLAHQRGRNDLAAERYSRSLELAEQMEPDGRQSAFALNSLGLLAKDVGDYERAIDHYRRALAIFRKIVPEGVEVAGSLNNLGVANRHLGNLGAAEDYYRQALELRRRIRPDSIDVASSLHNLGAIAQLRGDVGAARQYLQDALERKRQLVPQSLLEATTLFQLALLAEREEDLETARRLHGEALEIRRVIAPDAPATAASHCLLGELAYQRAETDTAIDHWKRAFELIGNYQGRLSLSPEEEAGFASPLQSCFGHYSMVLAGQGRVAHAFEVLETYRAHALRREIDRRIRTTAPKVPPDLLAEQRRAERSADRAEARLARLEVSNADLEAHRQKLRDLRSEQARLAAAVRAAQPPGTFPESHPPNLGQIRETLDPGTLLLSYGIGTDTSQLFVVNATQSPSEVIEQIELTVGWDELQRRVSVFRQLIERGREVDTVEPALIHQGTRLFDLLLAPVEEHLASADRVVIVAEGPLLRLPFSALVVDSTTPSYLANRLPIHHLPSATLLEPLRRHHGTQRREVRKVAVFADPTLPGAGFAGQLPRLPGSRDEGRAIARLFPGTTLFEGPQASEARVKRLKRTDVLHFATHATLHPRRPLESAILLAPPGADAKNDSDNGLLHAWEVMDQLHLDSDLVVLSACDTGAGRETPGEGLIGLTRAFLQAGSRSVVASLWRVDDEPTEALMTAFYQHLRDASSKDEALRSAQLDLLEGSDGSRSRHPYHWAGFQLYGDWL